MELVAVEEEILVRLVLGRTVGWVRASRHVAERKSWDPGNEVDDSGSLGLKMPREETEHPITDGSGSSMEQVRKLL